MSPSTSPPAAAAPTGSWRGWTSYAAERPIAWVDDNFDESCFEWAERRGAPTLLVPTEPHLGLEEGHVEALSAWATSLH